MKVSYYPQLLDKQVCGSFSTITPTIQYLEKDKKSPCMYTTYKRAFLKMVL
jgi:hypothetical protein